VSVLVADATALVDAFTGAELAEDAALALALLALVARSRHDARVRGRNTDHLCRERITWIR
jgi:hypothetical protein